MKNKLISAAVLSMLIIICCALVTTAAGIEGYEDFNAYTESDDLPASMTDYYVPSAGINRLIDKPEAEQTEENDRCADIGMSEGTKDVCQVQYKFPGGIKKFVFQFKMKKANDAAYYRIKLADKNGKTANNLETVGNLKIMGENNALSDATAFPKDVWHTIALDIDTEAGIYSLYINGAEISKNIHLPLKNTSSAPVDMDYSEGIFAVQFEVYASLSKEAHMYIDDIVIYTGNPIEVISSDVTDNETDIDTEISKIGFSFNNLLMLESLTTENIEFKANGTDVSFNLKTNACKITLIVGQKLKGSTPYTIVLKNITDFYGTKKDSIEITFTTTSKEKVKNLVFLDDNGEIIDDFTASSIICAKPIIENNTLIKQRYNLYMALYSPENSLKKIIQASKELEPFDPENTDPESTDISVELKMEDISSEYEPGCKVKLFVFKGNPSTFDPVIEAVELVTKEVN